MSLSLEQTLATILQSLADFFGVTTQTIIENAPIWLAKYGWYITIRDLGVNIFLGCLLGAVLVAILCLIFYIGFEADCVKWHILLFIVIFAFTVIITTITPIVTCAIAPEYVGIEALFNLIQN